MREDGTLNRLWKKWTSQDTACPDTGSTTDALGMKNVFMVFFLLAGAMVLVAAILAAEIRYSGRDQDSKASKYLCVKRTRKGTVESLKEEET